MAAAEGWQEPYDRPVFANRDGLNVGFPHYRPSGRWRLAPNAKVNSSAIVFPWEDRSDKVTSALLTFLAGCATAPHQMLHVAPDLLPEPKARVSTIFTS